MITKIQLDEIKSYITGEQIFDLLVNFGGEPQWKGDNIISRTICHCGNSHKLYWFSNTNLFRCFTECSDTFDIFQLVMKIKKDYTLQQAIHYITNFCSIVIENNTIEQDVLEDWNILRQYENNNKIKEEKQIVELKIYDDYFLKFLPQPRILNWEKEDILKNVMDKYNICYNPSSQAIVIPHYDQNNNLIGIRERTLIKENEIYGKYRPMILNKKMYNHPLGFSLYNLNNSKDNIKSIKKAILFERRKKYIKIR